MPKKTLEERANRYANKVAHEHEQDLIIECVPVPTRTSRVNRHYGAAFDGFISGYRARQRDEKIAAKGRTTK